MLPNLFLRLSDGESNYTKQYRVCQYENEKFCPQSSIARHRSSARYVPSRTVTTAYPGRLRTPPAVPGFNSHTPCSG